MMTTRFFPKLWLLLLAFSAIVLFWPFESSATPHGQASCGMLISSNSQPHAVNRITLKQDLSCTGTGLEIENASRVIVNCRGFAIHGKGTGIGLHLKNSENVSIFNCAFVDFERGVVIENSKLVRLNKVDVTGSSLIGIDLVSANRVSLNRVTSTKNGADGLRLTAASGHNSLSKSYVGGNALNGVRIEAGSNQNSIGKGTVVENNNANGVRADASQLLRVTGAVISGNRFHGIRLEDVLKARIRTNQLKQNGNNCIALKNTSASIIQANSLEECQLNGIRLLGSSQNRIAFNTGSLFGLNGISLGRESAENRILFNKFFKSGLAGRLSKLKTKIRSGVSVWGNSTRNLISVLNGSADDNQYLFRLSGAANENTVIILPSALVLPKDISQTLLSTQLSDLSKLGRRAAKILSRLIPLFPPLSAPNGVAVNLGTGNSIYLPQSLKLLITDLDTLLEYEAGED